MKHSLRFRLLAVMVTVVMVSTVSVGLLSRRFTHLELRRTQALGPPPDGALRDVVERGVRRRGSWTDARDELARRAATDRVLVVGVDGHVVLAPTAELLGATSTLEPDGAWRVQADRRLLVLPGPGLAVAGASGDTIGTVLLLPAPLPEDQLLASIDRWLLWIVGGVGLAGVALSIVIGRSVARPLETLTAAVSRAAEGARTVRVTVPATGEVAILADAFNRLSESLARQEQLRRNLVSDVAHELRTPLANIRCHLEALQDGVLAPEPAVLASALEETLRLAQLVDDLQGLALAEAGALRVEPGEFELGAEIAAVARAIQPRAHAAGLDITVDVEAALPRAHGDPARVAQILRNLLDNAITHTPRGGAIRIAASSANAELVISVRDTGSGIAPAHLPNVFERLYRADPARARQTGGAGLGLAIVKALVVAQGGRVWAQSVPGHGATFCFTLPAFIDRS